jgi:hypothetical protein
MTLVSQVDSGAHATERRSYMSNIYRLIPISLFVLLAFGTSSAQERAIEAQRDAIAFEPIVTVTAAAKRVRFVSTGTVIQLRLEIYNDMGQTNR